MRSCLRLVSSCLFLFSVLLHPAAAQRFDPVPAIRWESGGALAIRQPALPNHPFTVTGRSGAILGMQDGTAELWQLPVKFFSGLRLRAEVEGYPVPIELNPLAAGIEVTPDHTTLTYAHAAITVKQHMFVPAADPDNVTDPNNGLGGQILFEIHAIHPATLVISLTPALIRMWPAPQWGQPGWDWRPLGSGGVYTIGTDNPHLFGLIGMPGATHGAISPYQEHPRTLPMEFQVHYDPRQDDGRLFPLLCEVSHPDETNSEAGMGALVGRMLAINAALPAIYARTAAYYAHFFDHRTVFHTPEAALDKALSWAELAIDKAQATIPAQAGRPAETGLVAGWYPAFDSARPGFGWFFGRDTLWSMYAIDSEGDSALARRAFRFLIRRQRADGKMPHEFSETAESLTGDMSWDKLPYEYAAADSTPLFLLAMADYVRATGDLGFVRENWAAASKAYAFERTHDSDGDGVYDNSQGTGWVEGWPPKMPQQELYLAALDREATLAYAQLAIWTGHPDEARTAAAVASHLAEAVAKYRQPDGRFAFSRNADGSYDPTETIYPSVGLWWHGAGLPKPETMLDRWAGEHFETDWGTRALADTDPLYDPISYHQGTVWPLFTGWNTVAQYRLDRPLAAEGMLRHNLDLTFAQDPGAVTEVLSGRFYEPLGRSSTHQLWSSAMGLAPAMRELFGLEADAVANTLYLHPHLPAAWDHAALEHVRVGAAEWRVRFERAGAQLVVTAAAEQPGVLCMRAAPEVPELAPSQGCHEAASREHRVMLPLPTVELSLAANQLPTPGAETESPHVLGEKRTGTSLGMVVEASAGSTVHLTVRRNGAAGAGVRAEGGSVAGDELTVQMPAGTGWTRQAVQLRWGQAERKP